MEYSKGIKSNASSLEQQPTKARFKHLHPQDRSFIKRTQISLPNIPSCKSSEETDQRFCRSHGVYGTVGLHELGTFNDLKRRATPYSDDCKEDVRSISNCS